MLLSRANEPYSRISILPAMGAKIFDLIHRPTGQNFLWHNPRIILQPYPIEANFDNYWCGGRDDGFPTCEACTHNGEQYPNLGELRSVRWTVDAADESSVAMSAFGPISPVKVQKRVTLDHLNGACRSTSVPDQASLLPPQRKELYPQSLQFSPASYSLHPLVGGGRTHLCFGQTPIRADIRNRLL